MSDGTPLPNRSAETPVSGRNYPEDDPEGRRWSEIWRAAVEELNANALVSDLGANRVDYEPEDGTLFIPTDGGDWYLGTGTGWSNLGPVGDIGDHVGDTTNPHSVTAAQADALPTSGGTVTGDTTFTTTTHDSITTDAVSIAGAFAHYTSAQYTVPELNTALSNLPAGSTAVISGDWTVPAEGVQIPSNTTLINYGTLRQADSLDGDGIAVVRGASGDRNTIVAENITFLNYGTIDGNILNQGTGNDRHAVKFAGVDGLRVEGVHIINPVDFSLQIINCYNVRFANLSFQTGNDGGNQDGLHLTNCSDVAGHGVQGTTEDDLVAITVDDPDTTFGDIHITGVEGSSYNANILRLIVLETGVTCQNVRVELVGHDPGSNGVVIGGQSDTQFENLGISGSVRNTTNQGVDLTAGNFNNCTFNVDIDTPGGPALNAATVHSISRCDIDVSSIDPPSGKEAVYLANCEQSQVRLRSIRPDGANSGIGHIQLDASNDNVLDLSIEGGKSRGIEMMNGSSNNLIRGQAFEVTDTVTEAAACADNDYYFKTYTLLRNWGTRPRWRGVIGGGPIDGVDLSVTTGQFVGDKAMSNGTTGTAYLEATWNGSAWVQSDGTTV